MSLTESTLELTEEKLKLPPIEGDVHHVYMTYVHDAIRKHAWDHIESKANFRTREYAATMRDADDTRRKLTKMFLKQNPQPEHREWFNKHHSWLLSTPSSKLKKKGK